MDSSAWAVQLEVKQTGSETHVMNLWRRSESQLLMRSPALQKRTNA